MRRTSCRAIVAMLAAAALAGAGCGTVEPDAAEQLVVEAFVETDEVLPDISIRRSTPLRSGVASDLPADDASVLLVVDGEEVPYVSVGSGTYVPSRSLAPVPGSLLRLEVAKAGSMLHGESRAPIPIRIDTVDVRIPDRPVEAVLLDTLDLAPNVHITGYVYLVDVRVSWVSVGSDGAYVRVQLRPDSSFASRVIDLFLRSDQVLLEDELERPAPHVRQWNGTYAVRVGGPEAPLPAHALRVALLRSGRDYARYAWSRDAPDRREPLGNIEGGLGIFAGISLDTLQVQVFDD